MPPAGRPRPDKAVATDLVTYLETELDRAAFAQPEPGPSRAGAPQPRRVSQRHPRCARARDRRRVDAAERHRRPRIRQQRRRADALADADGAISWRGGEDQPDGARAAARRADAGNLLRADRSQPERADQRRSASRISRRRRASLLLSCRRRVPVRAAAERERRRRRVRGHYGRAASARHRHRQRQGRDRHVGRAGLRAAAWRRRRRSGRLSARGSNQENPRAADVPRAGQGRVSPGAGVLRLEDDGVCRRSVRPVAASRALSRRQRRATDFQRHDHRPSAGDGVGWRYARAAGAS